MSDVQRADNDRKELLKRALVRMQQLEAELRAERARFAEPLAIVGVGCRFPGGASDPDSFWAQLLAGFDATSEIPSDRWNVDDYYDPDPDTPGTMYVRRGAFLTEPVDQFDAAFFGIAPREADELDPQQRLLAEVVWETLERAGHSPASLRDSATGVYLGMAAHDWSRMQGAAGDTEGIGTYFGTGTAHSVAAGRIAYMLGLRGPALTIDTACSSSLVAFHEACQAVRAGEVRMAIVAGVSLILAPDGHVIASRGRMLSPNGRCSTFDASADGYVRGEGCAVVLVKRLSDAQADGDRILAIVRGTATNQDGRSSGLTAPNGVAQEDVMRAALAASNLTAADVSYIEAHGTGTELGDPIEVHALAALHARRPADRPLLIGSVKTNIGHLEAAAGLAGLIKTVLALRGGMIPPHLHFRTPNPHIDWDAAPIRVVTEPTPWPTERRIAGISSFGFSGTNVHVILEGAPAEERQPAAAAVDVEDTVVPLSARTPEALRELAGRLADHMAAHPELAVRDVARTLGRGRAHWEQRAAVIASDRDQLVAALRRIQSGITSDVPGLLLGEANLKRMPRVGFLFTGQGSQRPGMGRELLAASETFRTAVEECDTLLRPLLGVSVRDLIAADPDDEAAATVLQQTRITQPALFTLEYALAKVWASLGVEPSVVLGHSVGEYAAACVAGVFSLPDAITLIAERGRLMGELPEGGAMAAVFAPIDVVRARLEPEFAGRVSVAALNAPANTVVSGDADAVDALVAALAGDGVESRALRVSHAFHSHHMDPILDRFRAAAQKIKHAAPRIDVIANVTGERAESSTFGPDYWRRHIREPVQFSRSVEAMREEGVTALIEVGPAPVLLGLAAACPGADEDEIHIPSLRPGQQATRALLEAIGRLYVAGGSVDWARIYPGPLHPVELPAYPFQRQRHWFAERKAPSAERGVHPLLGRRIESPRFAGTIFEAELHPDAPEWIADHCVFDRAVLPGAAYLEMCSAAASLVIGSPVRVTGARILEPLVVESPVTLQTIVDPTAATVEIMSRDAAGQWRTHVSAGFDERRTQPDPVALLVDGAEVVPDTLLESIRAAGVSYGPSFRGLMRILRADEAASAEIAGNVVSSRERRQYGIHPALLDAAFQACGAFVQGGSDIYLPVEIESFELHGTNDTARDNVVARLLLREGGPGATELVCDVAITDGAATVVVRGLRFRRARQPAASIASRVASWLYSWEWLEHDPAAPAGPGGAWRIISDSPDAVAVADALKQAGCDVDVVSTSSAGSAHAGSPDGLLLLVPSASVPADGGEVSAAVRPALEPLLETARALALGGRVHRLVVVTRGAWPLDGEGNAQPAAAAAWGLGNTIRTELGGTACRFIDLDAETPIESIREMLANAALTSSAEDRLALRRGRWYAARLTRIPPRVPMALPDGDYCLEQSRQGDLDGLTFVSRTVEAPGEDEVTIRVHATGLNFRDVLNALGMYPGDAGPLGSEVVGTIEAVGSNVTDLRAGDVVMAITPRGFCSRVNAAAALTVPVPARMTAADAATIPIAFLTADWALNELAGLRRGERVLVHAAAGGVGMAAVQLAQATGAEIYATAGSRRKRELLRRMGVERIYDSRSTSFREEILRDTGGEGVHVILNSLANEFIPASLDVLSADGRFIEIGKTDVWDAQRVAEVRPGASYHVLYLGEACVEQPERVRARFLDLAARFENGELRPLPVRSFPVTDATAAFRYMAQARHVGKIVLEAEGSTSNDGAVWITGGLGGIGLAVAKRLVDEGVRQVVLTGRRGPSQEASAQIEAMRAAGADVAVLAGDVSRMEDVIRIRDEIAARGWDLRHVHHAAGVLDDATLQRQTWERFATVLGPKATGAWNLHLATQHLPLRSFILYSAGAALLGSPGQANYAAANAFLDGLALYRRSIGLPALSIAWGPWSEVGMAARAGLDWSGTGLGAIDPDAGHAALKLLQHTDATITAVLPIDWSKFAAGDAAVRPFFSGVRADEGPKTGVPATETWTGLLQELPDDERRIRVVELLAEEVMAVLGIDRSRGLGPKQGLTDLGMDSLMAVELSKRLSRALGSTLPSTFAFEYPTVDAMAGHVLSLIAPKPAREEAKEAVADAVVALMSEDDVSLALEDELRQLGY